MRVNSLSFPLLNGLFALRIGERSTGGSTLHITALCLRSLLWCLPAKTCCSWRNFYVQEGEEKGADMLSTANWNFWHIFFLPLHNREQASTQCVASLDKWVGFLAFH
ncbi:hypothetical protein, unlikely [Trypanosoma brucei gambiense DAL972]|uniref:Uncharacterized protein n=1 Tax=Trypanosoma brucei gambiense (strain MHOM/CI/86/DAL972) TaxID=679716 RepID=C9ZPM6_TRYB9|nr:hypothetical protein, unlikely [Trypanosoma brucei gambiense DAL972]CBH11354.1 hypothetical protein, unlikely [Trypanosoma brucei gambiense DAL972]|eukprot:XP_011773641.1 hypothetical protein, unlikely [Trypanosoma brucei gambiense DAL972]